MASVSKAKGFKVTCPFCLEGDSITLDLNDLRKLTCSGCGDEFTPQAARDKAAEHLARWESVVRWVESAPIAE